MNFDDYMKKIQKISALLEQNEYPENILNSKELDIKEDFQYICLSSAVNQELVNQIIVRLSQDGNEQIIEDNINSITMSMWKELFDKNDHIKKIFINNFNKILENTTVLTYREIEKFINDEQTMTLIYERLEDIIKKLCTYDRASLILILKNKPDGIKQIQENMEYFFQKGEFDISTTYSKILIELNNISEIDKINILKACNKNLSEMLNRETAIDNETNKLLNLIYDIYEATLMTEEQRAEMKENIDNAITKNFENILDRSNYDKSTIKLLKQFDCTKELFKKNENHFIEKSTRAPQVVQEYNKNYEKYINTSKIVDDLIEENKIKKDEKDTINTLENDICELEKKENLDNIYNLNDAKLEKVELEEKNIINNQITDLIKDNLKETDDIINKILKQSEIKKDNENDINDIKEINEDEINENEINKDEVNENNIIENIENQESEVKEKYNVENIEKNNIIQEESTQLIVKEENEVIKEKEENIFKIIWRKVLKLFGIKRENNEIE